MNYSVDNEENSLDLETLGGDIDSPADFDMINEENKNENIYNDNKIKPVISPQWGFAFLVILAVGILVYGFTSLSKTITGPAKLAEENNKAATAGETVTNNDNTATDLEALKNKDSDQDGLSDYDEQYVYGTSPYLADTDSDGYTDREEIQSQHDPLCPAGKDCRGTNQTNNTSTSSEVTVTPPLDTASTTASELTPEMLNQLINMTPAEVRDMLRQSGQISEEQLSQISDEELMQLFNEMIAEETKK